MMNSNLSIVSQNAVHGSENKKEHHQPFNYDGNSAEEKNNSSSPSPRGSTGSEFFDASNNFSPIQNNRSPDAASLTNSIEYEWNEGFFEMQTNPQTNERISENIIELNGETYDLNEIVDQVLDRIDIVSNAPDDFAKSLSHVSEEGSKELDMCTTLEEKNMVWERAKDEPVKRSVGIVKPRRVIKGSKSKMFQDQVARKENDESSIYGEGAFVSHTKNKHMPTFGKIAKACEEQKLELKSCREKRVFEVGTQTECTENLTNETTGNGKIEQDESSHQLTLNKWCKLSAKRVFPNDTMKLKKPIVVCQKKNICHRNTNNKNKSFGDCVRDTISNKTNRNHRKRKKIKLTNLDVIECRDNANSRIVKSLSKNEAQFHHHSHNRSEPYKECPLCQRFGLSFWTKKPQRLERHLKCHISSVQRGFECVDCGKKFHALARMLRHDRLVHTGVKDYECRLCGAEVTDLGIHLRIHRQERQFSCSICHVWFRHKNSMVRHMLRHSSKNKSLGNDEMPKTSVTTHECHVCSEAKFDSLSKLKEHMKIVHQNSKRTLKSIGPPITISNIGCLSQTIPLNPFFSVPPTIFILTPSALLPDQLLGLNNSFHVKQEDLQDLSQNQTKINQLPLVLKQDSSEFQKIICQSKNLSIPLVDLEEEENLRQNQKNLDTHEESKFKMSKV